MITHIICLVSSGSIKNVIKKWNNDDNDDDHIV